MTGVGKFRSAIAISVTTVLALGILALVSILTASCGDGHTVPEPSAIKPSEKSAKGAYVPTSAIPSLPKRSIEDLVYSSDLIARVKLSEVELVYREDGDLHYAELEYEFDALEYLKGGRGSSRIRGIVALPYAAGTDEKEVQTIAVEQMNDRETRWDKDEAIIFMLDSAPGVPSTHEADYYFLGWFVGGIGGSELVKARRWLPLASGTQQSSGERYFMLDQPEFASGSKATSRRGPTPVPNLPKDLLVPDGPRISLAQLNGLIAEDDASLRRRIDATVTADWQWKTEPLNLMASATHDAVTLGWDEARRPSEVIGYRVFRREDGKSEFVLLTELEADAAEMSYEDGSGIEPERTYTYRVLSKYPEIGRIVADDGYAEITVTTPASPTK